MDKIDVWVNFVKDQIVFQERMANKYYNQPYREALHQKSANTLREIGAFLESTKNTPQDETDNSPRLVSARRKIMLSLDDIKDIPIELWNELNLSETDKQEMMIESIINEAGGILSLDKILVELYKRTENVHKRAVVISRLYRMGSRGLIYSLPSKKGIYSTYELSEQDVKRLFGQLDGEPGEGQKGDNNA